MPWDRAPGAQQRFIRSANCLAHYKTEEEKLITEWFERTAMGRWCRPWMGTASEYGGGSRPGIARDCAADSQKLTACSEVKLGKVMAHDFRRDTEPTAQGARTGR